VALDDVAKPFRGQSVVISDNPEREYVVEVYKDLDLTGMDKLSQVNFKITQYEEYRQYVLHMLGASTV
jgi:hypothetical protein